MVGIGGAAHHDRILHHHQRSRHGRADAILLLLQNNITTTITIIDIMNTDTRRLISQHIQNPGIMVVDIELLLLVVSRDVTRMAASIHELLLLLLHHHELMHRGGSCGRGRAGRRGEA